MTRNESHMFRAVFINTFCIICQKMHCLIYVSSDVEGSDVENGKISCVIRSDIWQTCWLWLLSWMTWIYSICADWTNAIKLKTRRSCRWQEADIRSQLIKMELTWFAVSSQTCFILMEIFCHINIQDNTKETMLKQSIHWGKKDSQIIFCFWQYWIWVQTSVFSLHITQCRSMSVRRL